MKWRLYYGTGEIVSGETKEEAFAVPTVSALILKQEADNWRGYSIRQGCVAFCWENITLSDGTVLPEERWGGKSDWSGVDDYIGFRVGAQKIIRGREVHDDTFEKIMAIASRDGCLCTEPCKHVQPENY